MAISNWREGLITTRRFSSWAASATAPASRPVSQKANDLLQRPSKSVAVGTEIAPRPPHRSVRVPLFQEQAMRVAIECAGFTPGEADQLPADIRSMQRAMTQKS